MNNAIKTYPQLHRTFTLQKISVERCKTEFADCYHHKIKLAQESAELAARLKIGVELIQLLKTQGVKLTPLQNKEFKAFRNGANYLIAELVALAAHIQQVNKGDFEPTAYPTAKSAAQEEN